MRYQIAFLKNDIKFWLINLGYRLRFRLKRAKERNTLFFIFEPQRKHAGIADRLKAIISLYNLAKSNGYKFKLYFKTPFALSDYLVPQSDWEAEMDDLEYSILDTKIINETNWHKFPKLQADKQYHCYCYTGNEIPEVFKNTGYKWSELFSELFEPSLKIKSACDAYNLNYGSYISIHFRFVNALERFENTFFDNYLESEEERRLLIQKCKNGIQNVMNDNPNTEIYVFSDSKVFLQNLSDMNVKVLDYEEIGHTGEEGNMDSYLKSFIDLYVMAHSKCIYRALCPEIYQHSCYALLAARIGDIPFYDKQM